MARDPYAEEELSDPEVQVLDRSVERVSEQEIQTQLIRQTEDQVFLRAAKVMEGTLAFDEIDPEQPDPPEEWVRKLGHEEAVRRLRVAKYSLMSAKDAPVALAIAKSIYTSALKAKASSAGAARALNVAIVQMPDFVVPKFPEKKIEER